MEIYERLTKNKTSRRNGWKPDYIVCCHIKGTYDDIIEQMDRPESQCSIHFLISKDGIVSQLVPVGDTAWIKELAERQDISSISDRKTDPNYYIIGIGFEQTSHTALTRAQEATVDQLIGYINQQVDDIYRSEIPDDHIVKLAQSVSVPVVNSPPSNSSPKNDAEIKTDLDNQDITIGSRVKITGQQYSNGDAIPEWAKKIDYTAEMILDNKVLLTETYHWVNKSELSPV